VLYILHELGEDLHVLLEPKMLVHWKKSFKKLNSKNMVSTLFFISVRLVRIYLVFIVGYSCVSLFSVFFSTC